MIAVTQTATRYDLTFPDFDPKIRETWAAIRDVKALPGRMFDPTAKVWRIPLSASAEVRQLAEKYGAQIEELAIEAGYPADAAHRIATLEAQLAAVPRIGDDSPPLPTRKPSTNVLSLEDMIESIKAAGYSVTRRKAASVQHGDVRACVHCGGVGGLRIAVLDGGKGHRSATNRRQVGVCGPCYRFGPGLAEIPVRPTNPELAARLFAVWRRTHHRYARRYAAQVVEVETGRVESVEQWSPSAEKRVGQDRPIYWYPIKEADKLTESLKKAMQNQPMTRTGGLSKLPKGTTGYQGGVLPPSQSELRRTAAKVPA